MASTHAQHIQDLHFRVLKLLHDKPDTSQRDLAAHLGISNGKMNYCLNALMEKGLVTLYVRRCWYDRIGGFDDRYRIAADYLSILQLFSQPDFKAVYLPEVLVTMRMGGISNRSLKTIARKTLEDWRALRQTRIGAFGGLGALLWKNLSKLGQFR